MRDFAVTFLAGVLAVPSVALSQHSADQHYDAAEMAAARGALKASHGGQLSSLVLGERFEFQSNDGAPILVWEAQASVGSDINKFSLKTEGEYETDDGKLEEAELQLLYSRAIGAFWDLQAGIRHDVKPDPARTYAVLGLQGLAPYWFEIDASLFLSDNGDLSARIESEYEFRLTQRLILQPRLEMNVAFANDAAVGVGSGLASTDLGLRLRYEFRREVAPYIGVSWIRAFGSTRDLQQMGGEDSSQLSFVAGLRFWF